MNKAKYSGVKALSGKPHRILRPIGCIPQKRMPYTCHMHADLMCSSRFQLTFYVIKLMVQMTEHFVMCHCTLTILRFHRHLLSICRTSSNRCIHCSLFLCKIIIRVVIAAVILLAGIGVFQWHNYQQKVEYRKEALLYFKEEDYSKTISYLGQALKLQSVFAGKLDLDMTCYLAESHYQLKEYDEAEKIYDKLINNDSKNAQYYILKGECLAKSGDAKAAVKVYEQGWNSA